MFAVIKTGGKQYRVAENDVLRIARVKGEPGEIVQLGDVMMVGGDSPQLGSPMISGASVAVEIVSHDRSRTIITFKKRRRKNSKRTRGYRDQFTTVRVSEILTDGKSPTKKAREKPAPKPKVEAEGGDADMPAKKPAKAAAKKPVKAAAKKAAPAKKPAAKKPAAKAKK